MKIIALGNQFFKSLLLVLFMLCTSTLIFGQDDLIVYGIVRNKDTSAKLEGVQCQVKKDGAVFDSQGTNKTGKYEFDMPLGFVYEFRFSFQGLAHKIIVVDTKNMNPEDHKGGFEMNMDITLFSVEPEFDLSIMDKPFGKAKFDNLKNDLIFDFDYTEVQNLKVEDELDRVADLIANREKMQKDFDLLMEKGRDKVMESKYEDAVGKFKDALKIFPNDETAKKKLAEAEQLLADSQKDKEKDSQYQKLLAEGNKEFKAENWGEAKDKYEAALKIKPNEVEPKNKIKDIDSILANMMKRSEYNELVADADAKFDSEDYEGAIKKYQQALDLISTETYPRERIKAAQNIMDDLANAAKKEEELEKEYNDLMKFAQANFKDQEYVAAREKFVDASKLKPKEDLPKRKIDEIDQILEELAAAKLKEEKDNAANAERDKMEAEYQAFIQKGNDNFKEKNWENALIEYQGALFVKDGDTYATKKIESINDILDELAEEKAKKEVDNSEREAEEALTKKFNDLITQGDDLFNGDNLESARTKYEKALELKPSEKYPKRRIDQIADLIAQRSIEKDDDEYLADLARKKQEEEDARRAEEERIAEELAEKQRLLAEKKMDVERDSEKKSENHSREYSTINADVDDKVVKYYRDAKKSGDLAKIDMVNEIRDANDKLHENSSSNSNVQRRDNYSNVSKQRDNLVEIELNGADTRSENVRQLKDEQLLNESNKEGYEKKATKNREKNYRIVDDHQYKQESLQLNDKYRERKTKENDQKKERFEDQKQKFESKGDAGRVDNVFEIERTKETTARIESKAEDKRLENVKVAEDEETKRTNYNKDLRDANQVKREENHRMAEESKEQMATMKKEKEFHRIDKQSKVEQDKDQAQAFNESKELDAQMRRLDAVEEVNSKYKGSEKDPEDYLLTDGASDVRYGVSETSREQGNKTIIERTVREGNKIDVYRKVVSKTGIYYFKNGKSCTQEIWELETISVLD